MSDSDEDFGDAASLSSDTDSDNEQTRMEASTLSKRKLSAKHGAASFVRMTLFRLAYLKLQFLISISLEAGPLLC